MILLRRRPRRRRRRRREGIGEGQSHFQSRQSSHRLMECNRTLASHRLALLFVPFASPSDSSCSPPRASDASADFSLCPCALFLLREIGEHARVRTRVIVAPDAFRRYFKKLCPRTYFCRFYFYMLPYSKLVS